MPISGFTPQVSTMLAQQKLAQVMVTQQVARSVVITFVSGGQVTLNNATVTQSLATGNGAGTIQITYQGATTTNTVSPTTATDDWLA